MIQVTKIHNVLGTPTPETLNKLKKHSNSHIDFNFPPKEGTPLQKLLPHCRRARHRHHHAMMRPPFHRVMDARPSVRPHAPCARGLCHTVCLPG